MFKVLIGEVVLVRVLIILMVITITITTTIIIVIITIIIISIILAFGLRRRRRSISRATVLSRARRSGSVACSSVQGWTGPDRTGWTEDRKFARPWIEDRTGLELVLDWTRPVRIRTGQDRTEPTPDRSSGSTAPQTC